MCGVGSEISAIVVEEAFDALDAPIGRLHTEPVSHPFCPILEDAVTANAEKIIVAAQAVLAGKPQRQHRAVGVMPKTASTTAVGGNGSVPHSSNGNGSAASLSPLAKADSAHAAPAPATHAAFAPAPAASAPAAAPKSIQNGVPVVMPNMDLIITEATIVAWFKKVGDKVTKGEALLEIETDKAVTQVESPADGVLAEILTDAGTVVPLGQQLGTIAP
jgi:2-oxoisovalerate dehydrogenase E1 component